MCLVKGVCKIDSQVLFYPFEKLFAVSLDRLKSIMDVKFAILEMSFENCFSDFIKHPTRLCQYQSGDRSVNPGGGIVRQHGALPLGWRQNNFG